MQDQGFNMFRERVRCEARWPVDVQPLDGLISPQKIARLAEHNAHVLATAASLEDRRAEASEDDGPVLQELARLDAKVNALVDMVNRLLVPADVLPRRRLVRLNALGAQVPDDVLSALPSDAPALLLRLRLDACPSLPLELPAQRGPSIDGETFVAFRDLGEPVSDAIERLVFRHHRRKVAESRHSPGAS